MKKPSWLLGTMHMVCAENFVIKEKVLKALAKCRYYYMEVDLGSADEMGTMQNNQSFTTDLGASLSDKERDELDEILIREFGITVDQASQFPPVTLINRIATDAIECEELKMVEVELLQIALSEGLETGGLETAFEQLVIAGKVFDGKEILHQLKSTGDYKELFREMVDAYKNEDLHLLAGLVNDKRFMSRRAYRILVNNRNKRWAKQIPALANRGSSFIAVGAGHLAGENGVISLLRQQGFSVNPVYR